MILIMHRIKKDDHYKIVDILPDSYTSQNTLDFYSTVHPEYDVCWGDLGRMKKKGRRLE